MITIENLIDWAEREKVVSYKKQELAYTLKHEKRVEYFNGRITAFLEMTLYLNQLKELEKANV